MAVEDAISNLAFIESLSLCRTLGNPDQTNSVRDLRTIAVQVAIVDGAEADTLTKERTGLRSRSRSSGSSRRKGGVVPAVGTVHRSGGIPRKTWHKYAGRTDSTAWTAARDCRIGRHLPHCPAVAHVPSWARCGSFHRIYPPSPTAARIESVARRSTSQAIGRGREEEQCSPPFAGTSQRSGAPRS
jgi:hypothetical protein